MQNSELLLKLDRARWHIMSVSPFYGQLMMSLADVIGNPHGKTACTDGRRIKWDAEFLGKLSDEETRYVLMHETLHCAHGHLWRFPAGSIDHPRANQACDHAINLTLNSAGLNISMPKGGLADSQFEGMAEEEIYSALAAQKQPEQKGNPEAGNGAGQGESQSGNGDGDACGDFTKPDESGAPKPGNGDKPGKDGDSGAPKPDGGKLREQWQRAVIQAGMAAKASQGTMPGDLARQLEKFSACPIDWRQETANFVKNSISNRNDWTRSPRRHSWQSVIYPSRKASEIGCIIGVRDTSGSIDDKLAAEFSAILASACAELNCALILIDCDAGIQAEYRIEAGGEVPLTAKGGGGTDFSAPFVRAAELIDGGEKIAGLVYLTDLYGSGWPAEENFPSLCICTNSNQAPSGKTIQAL